jgi:hypothetical protein
VRILVCSGETAKFRARATRQASTKLEVASDWLRIKLPGGSEFKSSEGETSGVYKASRLVVGPPSLVFKS